MDNEKLLKRLQDKQIILQSHFDLIKIQIEECHREIENVMEEMNKPGNSKQQING